MTGTENNARERRELAIDVIEIGKRPRNGWLACRIGRNVRFSVSSLESFFFTGWNPLLYDALLIAASVEFADRSKRRPTHTWKRDFRLRIPVHDPDCWKSRSVSESLHNVLSFLTGDSWEIEFSRRGNDPQIRQGLLSLGGSVDAVIPYSDGLDSRLVAGMEHKRLGDRLVLVRLGSKLQDREGQTAQRRPFTSVPFHVKHGASPFCESSARTRGFKFALISALAAHIADARQVILPESGQGILGPALVPVGQSYADYRNHPFFASRMEDFIQALVGYRISFRFPRLWNTKAETLTEFTQEFSDRSFLNTTWSCWQQSRQVTVQHRKRQCGVCAACILRRMSIHAAGLIEPKENYVWENLSAPTFDSGASTLFDEKKKTRAMREYAIAGTLHLDHLAGLKQSRTSANTLSLASFQLSTILHLKVEEVRSNLDRLLEQHAAEWKSFIGSLGASSFITQWALSA